MDQFKYIFFYFWPTQKPGHAFKLIQNSKKVFRPQTFCQIISVLLTENIPVKTWQIRQIENMSKNWADRADCPPQLSGSNIFTSHGECVRPVEKGKKVLNGEGKTILLIRIKPWRKSVYSCFTFERGVHFIVDLLGDL